MSNFSEMNNGWEGSDTNKISTFRRALPQFLAVGVKNMLLFGNLSKFKHNSDKF